MAKQTMSAAAAIAAILAKSGNRAVFGNPGTTELPILQAIGEVPELRYYLSLQEDISTGMAAGYAAASGRVGVSLLHVAPGVAHGLNNYYNATRNGLPVLLMTGQQDRRHQFLNPMLYADLQSMMAPFSKWSWEARTADEVPFVLARALTEAASPPAGGTFLSIPLDVQMDPLPDNGADLPLPINVQLGVAREAEVKRAAELLLGAQDPAIIAGDIIGAAGCSGALGRLADVAASAVYWEPMSMFANYPKTDPMFQGILFPSGEDFRRVFDRHDVVLVCGMGLRAPLLYGGTAWSGQHARVVLLTDDTRGLGAGLNVELALVGDAGLTIDALVSAMLAAPRDQADSDRAAQRHKRLQADWATARGKLEDSAARRAEQIPISPGSFLSSIAKRLPPNTTIVDEAVSNSGWVALAGQYVDAIDYLGPSKGGGIGFGLPAAIGVKVARPDRNVVAFLGDGSALYSIQGLWTAAHHRLPVVFCILNNASYRILKAGLMTMLDLDSASIDRVPGMNLSEPEPDFVQCAKSLGIDAVRTEGISASIDAILEAIKSERPWLIDVSVERTVRPVLR